jgi:hypothetical protein
MEPRHGDAEHIRIRKSLASSSRFWRICSNLAEILIIRWFFLLDQVCGRQPAMAKPRGIVPASWQQDGGKKVVQGFKRGECKTCGLRLRRVCCFEGLKQHFCRTNLHPSAGFPPWNWDLERRGCWDDSCDFLGEQGGVKKSWEDLGDFWRTKSQSQEQGRNREQFC